MLLNSLDPSKPNELDSFMVLNSFFFFFDIEMFLYSETNCHLKNVSNFAGNYIV